MSKYFDKDFFRFLLGFVTIIAFSLIVILVARTYKDSQVQTANVIQTVTPKN